MGCPKLTYHPEFLHLAKETAIEKSDHENFLPLGEKNVGKEICIDYYPGGATFNSWTRENSVPNNIKFQETEWQDELGLNLYDFDARLYDPYTWRTPTQDPHAEYYPEISPYSFLSNNPVNSLDPTGMDAFGLNGSNDIAICPTCPNTPQYQPYIDDPNNNYIYDPTSGGVSILLDEVVVTDKQQASITYAPPAPSFDFELPPLARIGAGVATVAAMTIALVLSPLEAGTGEAEELARINKKNHEDFIKKMQMKNRNPAQDKPLSKGEIEKLKRNGWDHSDKGKRGGRTDLYKDKDGNIYQKPKGGAGEGEPIGINLNDLN
jgi:RHS repeat-associated protein